VKALAGHDPFSTTGDTSRIGRRPSTGRYWASAFASAGGFAALGARCGREERDDVVGIL
jgi:hypothetical protein